MMTSTQILAIGAPWIIAVIGFIAYLVWPEPTNRPVARAPKNPGTMTLDEAMSAIDGGLKVIAAQQESPTPPKPQRVPERISS